MLIYDKIVLDPDAYTVTYEGRIVSLSPKEFFLFKLFLQYPNRVLNYDTIIDTIWGIERTPNLSRVRYYIKGSIRSHIKGIRKALRKANADDRMIETVHGMGYRLKPLNFKTQRDELRKLQKKIQGSVFKCFLEAKSIEYMVFDENLLIKYLSPGVINYCDFPDILEVGIHAGHAFPEFIGFEEAFEKVRKKESEFFEVKGIARNANLDRIKYINFCVVTDSYEDLDCQLLFVFFEDATEHLMEKQRRVQQEIHLLLC